MNARLVLAAAVLAAGCAPPHPPAPATSVAAKPEDDVFPETPKASDPEREQAGCERALRDIAAGDPHLVFIGLPSASASPLDTETGLPAVSIGCMVGAETVSYAKGYNEAMLAAVKAGTVRTYADRVTTAAALAERLAAPDAVELTEANAAADAPGGRFRVELGTVTYSFDAPGTPPTPYLFVVEVASGSRRRLDYLGEMRARIAFDPGGETVLVRDERYHRSMTFDLASGRTLQQFSDDRPRKPKRAKSK